MIKPVADFFEVIKWNTRPSDCNDGSVIWDNRIYLSFTLHEGTFLSLPKNGVYWEDFRAITPRQGHGTRALRWVTQNADENRICLFLDACAPDAATNPQSQRRLEGLYERHGFQSRGGSLMIRQPCI